MGALGRGGLPAGGGPARSGPGSRRSDLRGRGSARALRRGPEGGTPLVRPGGSERRLLRRKGRPAALPRPSDGRSRARVGGHDRGLPHRARGERVGAVLPERAPHARGAPAGELSVPRAHGGRRARPRGRTRPAGPGGVDGPRDRRDLARPARLRGGGRGGDVHASRYDRRAVARDRGGPLPRRPPDRQPAAPVAHRLSRGLSAPRVSATMALDPALGRS